MKKNERGLSAVEIVVGFLSFIPFLGVLFALVSIVLGVVKFRIGGGKLILLGILGFVVNLGVYLFLFHFTLRLAEGKGDVKQALAQDNLRETVLALEFYKQVHGRYPMDLKEVVPQGNRHGLGDVFLYDGSFDFSKGGLHFHHYDPTPDGQSYSLYDLGQDATPGTKDDIYPVLSPEEAAHAGYRPPPTPLTTP